MSLQSILAKVRLWDGTNQASVTAGNALKVDISATGANTTAVKVDGSAVTQPISAASLPSHPVTNAGTFAVQAAQSGAWTVQPGNTANTTAWKVDGSAVTQPVSGTVTANIGTGNLAGITGVVHVDDNSGSLTVDNAGTFAVQATLAVATGTLSAWTSATALNATQNIFTGSGVEAAIVHLVQTTTLTAGAITFEVTFDGTNWITAPADAVLDPTSVTFAQISLPYTVQASANKAFIVTGKGWQGLRIKLSTQITGTGSVTPNYALLNYDPAMSVIAYNPTAANFKVDLSGTAANTTALKVDPTGNASGTSTLSNVASSATSVTLLAANSGRRGATIYNDSTQVLYVKFGTTASNTSYTVQMAANAYYEIPFQHTGRIDGIWASANGNARVTEFT